MKNPIVYVAGDELCFVGYEIGVHMTNCRLLGNVYRDDVEYTVYASVKMSAKSGGVYIKEKFRRHEFVEIKTS